MKKGMVMPRFNIHMYFPFVFIIDDRKKKEGKKNKKELMGADVS